MKKFNVLCASLLAGIALLPFASCGDKEGGTATDDFQIKISESRVEMNEGETYSLKVTVSPDDPKEKKVDWSSSDSGVASVSQGEVTAKTAGEAVITATSNGKSDTCKVTVRADRKEEDNAPDGDGGEMPEGGSPESAPEGEE